MRELPPIVDSASLPLSAQFEEARLISEINGCNDVETLRKIAISALKTSNMYRANIINLIKN
jgi:5,10-methylene-tetrahydrofolate dehydrogenase/methenyl tetrahydrofolate cyclohydrolase